MWRYTHIGKFINGFGFFTWDDWQSLSLSSPCVWGAQNVLSVALYLWRLICPCKLEIVTWCCSHWMMNADVCLQPVILWIGQELQPFPQSQLQEKKALWFLIVSFGYVKIPYLQNGATAEQNSLHSGLHRCWVCVCICVYVFVFCHIDFRLWKEPGKDQEQWLE